MIRHLPSNYSMKVHSLPSYSKAPIRILPQNLGVIKNNQILKIVLPVGVILDISTFAIHFNFLAKQNNAAVAAGNIVGMPKYTASLFDSFECFINSRQVQHIQSYNRIYNVLKDFKSNHDSQMRKLSNNSDPSVYQTMTNTGDITKINTALTPAGTVPGNGFAGRYVIDDFIGFLGCQKIIDTNLTGPIELSFRLAGPNVLWHSGAATTAVSFEIDDVVCYCDSIYYRDDNYYAELKRDIESADGLKIKFDNFSVYTGAVIDGTGNKTVNVKCSENCKSLDYILWTYFDTQSTGLENLYLGDNPVAAADANALLAGDLPESRYNFDNLLRLRDEKLLNTSQYFRRNGLANNLRVEFQINSQPITTQMNLQEQWEETLKCFELHLDSDNKSINPAIYSMPVFQKDFYVCALSTSAIGNRFPQLEPILSGRDTMSTSMQITVSSTDSAADASHGNCQPHVITKYSSVLHIFGERNILPSK
jgi:hypothetical protein